MTFTPQLETEEPRHTDAQRILDEALPVHTHNPHPLTAYFVQKAEADETPETATKAASTRPALSEYADVNISFRFRRTIEVFGNGPDDYETTPILQSIRTTKNALTEDERTFIGEHFGQSDKFHGNTVWDIINAFTHGPASK